MVDPITDPAAEPAPQLTPAEQEAANFSKILESIKRDDGSQKFDKVDTALQSIQPKDDHIKSLETENAKLKEDISKFGSQEEILKKFMDNRAPAEEAKPASPQLDQDTLSEMLTGLLNKRDEANVETANVQKVAQVLATKYGEKATEVMSAKAKEMGVSEDYLKEIIAKSPEAGLELLGISKDAVAAPAKLNGSQNTENFNQAPTKQPKSVLGTMFITNDEVQECWDACSPDKYTGN